MKKGIYALILTFVVSTFGFTAFAKTSAKKSDDNSITLFSIMSTNANFKAWLADAEKATGIKINVVAAPTDSDTRQQKVTTVLSSGDSSIDVLEINDEMSTAFKNTGWLEPLQKDVITKDVLKQLPQGYVKDMITSKKGDIIGVPGYKGYLAFWVDGKKLKEAGMKDIKTKDDFVKFIKATTKNGNYGYGGSWEKTYVFNEIATFVNLFGGDYLDWTNPANKEALKFMYDMANTWKVTPKAQLADKYEQMNQKFIDGKYACLFMWGTGTDYKKAGRYGQDQIHIVQMPKFKTRSVFTDSWSYVLNASSKHKEAAKKFLQYMASVQGGVSNYKYFERYPARADAAAKANIAGDVKGIYKVYQDTTIVRGRPMLPQTMEFISAMGTIFSSYIQNQITLDQFCKKAQEYVKQYQ
jgi:multiple sugar transport system substrate-binding protein